MGKRVMSSVGWYKGSQYKHIGMFADKVLAGGAPANLPIEQPTKFELIITWTAKRSALPFPRWFKLAQTN